MAPASSTDRAADASSKTSPGSSPPAVWLERITEHVLRFGLEDASMRRLASVAGTSHRMLAYYFGSADGVLGAVMDQLRKRERNTLMAAASTRREAMELSWAYYTSPKRILEMQIFFLLAGKAVRAPDQYWTFLDTIVSTWVEAMTTQGLGEGLSESRARLDARLLTASARGLLMDRLLAQDPENVDAAFQRLLDCVLNAPPS